MKKYLMLVAFTIIFVFCTQLNADTWAKTYGGTGDDYGNSVQQTKDGGFIIAGETKSFGTGRNDVYLIRTNSSGDTVWTKTFGGTSWDVGSLVQQTQDSGFIIAGCTHSFGAGNEDVYLIRANSSGNTLWTKTFGGTYDDYGCSVAQCSDGGFIIAGSTFSYGIAGYVDAYLIKTNSSGDTVWTKTFGGTDADWSYSVQQTSDGGFIIAGTTYSFGAGTPDSSNVYLIKTTSSGNTLWTRTFGGTSNDEGYFVQQTYDSGFIIVGYTYSFGAGDEDVYLIRTNSSGNTLWTKTFGGTGPDCSNSVQQTKDGGFIITGWTYSFGAGDEDVYLIRTNSSGDTLWTKTFGGTGPDCSNSVQQTKDGGFIITGWTDSFGAGYRDVYLIKTDSLGIAIEESSSQNWSKATFRLGGTALEISKNPFSQSTVIKYFIPIRTRVILSVYDISGSCVKTLVNGEKETGTYSIGLNAKELKAGIYFVRLTAGGDKETKKLVLMK
ncbi:MAG: T9SS type A sorting domain-containing protein [bacterium]|nr:T9SS type A sorting domain-containing protein [bacterium]